MPQVIDAVTQEESGLRIQVVEPGGPDDPFTDLNRAASSAFNAASPAVEVSGGTPVVQPGDGLKSQPVVQPVTTPSPTPAPATTQPTATPEADLTPMQQAIKDGKLDEYIDGLVGEKVGTALRSQQGNYDKRYNALKDELDAAREAAKKSEREGKLAELSDDEADILKNKWELEDERSALNAYSDELDNYFRAMYVANLVQQAEQFGVTAEALEQFTEPEEMDVFVKDKELEWFRSGKTTTTVPARTVVVPEGTTEQAPAGASAQTDIGGGAPSAPPATLETGVGLDAMAANINKLPWVTLRMPA